MGFLNTGDAIITDKAGSIYSFRLLKEGIELIVHEKFSENVEQSIIISGEVLEYDVSINERDRINLICKKKDKSLSIYSLTDGEWVESVIYEEASHDTCGLRIISLDKNIHIFYYRLSLEDNNKLSIYHHYLEDQAWTTNIVKDIYKGEIIKPIELIKEEDSLLIGYYDLGYYSEDIFISRFFIEENEWREAINITRDDKVKLYLDFLQIDGFTHITYSEYEDENLTIKHKKIKLNKDEYIEVSESLLSNQVNCTYPTLISTGDVFWNVWTEYEHVVSSYSKDDGETWSNPYIWNESKKEDFSRYKFANNEDEIKANYKMNYSFSKTYPNLSLLGFGDLSGATESFKKKEESGEMIDEENHETHEEYVDYENYEHYERNIIIEEFENIEKLKTKISQNTDKINMKIERLGKEIIQMQKRLRIMDEELRNRESESLDKRIRDIENYLHRRRSPFSSRT